MSNETSAEYQRATWPSRRTSSATWSRSCGFTRSPRNDGEIEVISGQKVREIFAGVVGVLAADKELGPEPTGQLDVTKLATSRPRPLREAPPQWEASVNIYVDEISARPGTTTCTLVYRRLMPGRRPRRALVRGA
jgi:hypothetical protein